MRVEAVTAEAADLARAQAGLQSELVEQRALAAGHPTEHAGGGGDERTFERENVVLQLRATNAEAETKMYREMVATKDREIQSTGEFAYEKAKIHQEDADQAWRVRGRDLRMALPAVGITLGLGARAVWFAFGTQGDAIDAKSETLQVRETLRDERETHEAELEANLAKLATMQESRGYAESAVVPGSSARPAAWSWLLRHGPPSTSGSSGSGSSAATSIVVSIRSTNRL